MSQPNTLRNILRSPLDFTLCSHSAPPTPLPLHTITANATLTAEIPARIPHRCIHCDIQYRLSSQSLILETYNGLVRDQRNLILLASDTYVRDIRTDRKDTDEIIALAREEMEDLKARRELEVQRVWAGFVQRWDLAQMKVGMVRVWLVRDTDGGRGIESTRVR